VYEHGKNFAALIRNLKIIFTFVNEHGTFFDPKKNTLYTIII